LDTLDHYKYLFADFNQGGGTSQGALGAANAAVPGTPIGGPSFYWFQAYTDASRAFLVGSTPIQLGQWYHLAVVRDDGAKTVRLFVNGVEEGMISYAGRTVVPLQSNKLLGGSGLNFLADFMDGQLDEVAVYDRSLSAAEVLAIATAADDIEPSGGNGVYVNLPLGQATGLRGGIANIRDVVGSGGDDILVGTGGNVLDGRAGRDVLIAGSLAASTLLGGEGDDLLIGGATYNDTHPDELFAIRAVWTSDADYAARAAALRNGWLNFDSASSNGKTNLLLGQGGRDLFFGAHDFDAVDVEADEIFYNL